MKKCLKRATIYVCTNNPVKKPDLLHTDEKINMSEKKPVTQRQDDKMPASLFTR